MKRASWVALVGRRRRWQWFERKTKAQTPIS